MSVELKPCPNCGCGEPVLFRDWVECRSGTCCVMGPNADPDGAKWNALPRDGDSRTPGTIEVPVAEVEALRVSHDWVKHRNGPGSLSASMLTRDRSIEAIIARLPPREPDHVANLRKLLRNNENVLATEMISALEAAIRAMGCEP